MLTFAFYTGLIVGCTGFFAVTYTGYIASKFISWCCSSETRAAPSAPETDVLGRPLRRRVHVRKSTQSTAIIPATNNSTKPETSAVRVTHTQSTEVMNVDVVYGRIEAGPVQSRNTRCTESTQAKRANSCTKRRKLSLPKATYSGLLRKPFAGTSPFVPLHSTSISTNQVRQQNDCSQPEKQTSCQQTSPRLVVEALQPSSSSESHSKVRNRAQLIRCFDLRIKSPS